MKSITNFIANYKTTLAGVVLGILTIAQQAGCIAPNDLVSITGLLTSLGLFVAKDADRTGVL